MPINLSTVALGAIPRYDITVTGPVRPTPRASKTPFKGSAVQWNYRDLKGQASRAVWKMELPASTFVFVVKSVVQGLVVIFSILWLWNYLKA
jgi:hypothetical protein